MKIGDSVIVKVFFVLSLLFFSSWCVAEMVVTTIDGKRYTLPVKGSEVKNIEFIDSSQGSFGGAGSGNSPMHKYKAVLALEGITWEEANSAAQAMGGRLATIRNAEENEYVYSLISNDDRFWFVDAYGNALGPWLGGRQPNGSPEPAGGWAWVTGEAFSYANWGPGEPNNSGNSEDRLQFFGSRGVKSAKWNDISGSFRAKGYIVEFDSDYGGNGAGTEKNESVLFKLHSLATVYNNPPKKTIFSLNKPSRITKIFTYHWNNGKGDKPGTIGLRNLATGEVVGTWSVVGTHHMFASSPGVQWPSHGDGPPYLYWTVQPNIVVPAGTYQVEDSNPYTWSTNWEMNHMGCAWVYGTDY